MINYFSWCLKFKFLRFNKRSQTLTLLGNKALQLLMLRFCSKLARNAALGSNNAKLRTLYGLNISIPKELKEAKWLKVGANTNIETGVNLNVYPDDLNVNAGAKMIASATFWKSDVEAIVIPPIVEGTIAPETGINNSIGDEGQHIYTCKGISHDNELNIGNNSSTLSSS